jgi:hypothetical protein
MGQPTDPPVPLGSLGPRPCPSSPPPLLPSPVWVAQQLVQRGNPLMQAGRLLVGDDRKFPGRVDPLNRAGRQRLARLHVAGDLDLRAMTGPGDASQPLERDRRVDPFPLHQRPLGLLDHHPVLQGDLQLAGQAALGIGGHRVAEQVGHHPGAGLQGADLALVPGTLASRVDIQGADRPAGPLQGTLSAALKLAPSSAEAISSAPSPATSRTGTGARCQNASVQGPCASSS